MAPPTRLVSPNESVKSEPVPRAIVNPRITTVLLTFTRKIEKSVLAVVLRWTVSTEAPGPAIDRVSEMLGNAVFSVIAPFSDDEKRIRSEPAWLLAAVIAARSVVALK